MHLTSEAAPRLACLPDSSANYVSGSPFRSSTDTLSAALSSSSFSFSPIIVVFGLTSVFFSLSLALFAICTGLVDINIKLEDTYIRYVLFLDRLCNVALRMIDGAGEAFLATPSRISSEFLDAVATFSRLAFHVHSSALLILDQGVWVPVRHTESLFNLLHIARLAVQGRALTICAASRNLKLAPHLCRIPFREARCRAAESSSACFLLGAGWIYARGRSLYAVICAGATLALALAVRLPSGRTYSRAWSGAMRPRGGRPMLSQPDTSQLHHGEAVLTWCVRPRDSHAPVQDVNTHTEMSFNITLDLDIDEDGDLRVALVPDAAMQGPAIMLRVLCDADTQTEDQDPGTEEQEVHTEEGLNVGVAPAALQGGSERESMDGLGPTSIRSRATLGTRSHVPAFHAQAFTFKFNPQAPSFSPAPSASRTRLTPDGLYDTARGTRLNPLAEEFSVKVPALFPVANNSLANAPGYGPDLQTNGCAGDSVLPPHSESKPAVLRAALSSLPLDALTFASPLEGPSRPMGRNGGLAEGIAVRDG
ncbi:hypothetical protein V8D89_002646 [Ganoderma adspersum]